MRLAGTCSRYSKSAIPQLANAATYQGRDDKLRRWAYQANVMKTFEAMRRQTVTMIVRIAADGNAPRASDAVLDAESARRYGAPDFDDIQDVRDHALDAREEPRICPTRARRCHRRHCDGQHSSDRNRENELFDLTLHKPSSCRF